MRFLFVLFILLFGKSVLAQQRISTSEYIEKFAPIAMDEMRKFKIPASVTLGQGILESAYGNSELARKAHNHFGIKCKPEWEGMRYYYGASQDACYRKYKSDSDSYYDHSLFLAYRSYYKDLFKLEISDYKGWSYGLKRAGYATSPTYAQNLIGVIEKFKLNRFDSLVLNDTMSLKQTSSVKVDTIIQWGCYELVASNNIYLGTTSNEVERFESFEIEKEKDAHCAPFILPRRSLFAFQYASLSK